MDLTSSVVSVVSGTEVALQHEVVVTYSGKATRHSLQTFNLQSIKLSTTGLYTAHLHPKTSQGWIA